MGLQYLPAHDHARATRGSPQPTSLGDRSVPFMSTATWREAFQKETWLSRRNSASVAGSTCRRLALDFSVDGRRDMAAILMPDINLRRRRRRLEVRMLAVKHGGWLPS
jgi:hypothetical protein